MEHDFTRQWDSENGVMVRNSRFSYEGKLCTDIDAIMDFSAVSNKSFKLELYYFAILYDAEPQQMEPMFNR